MTTAAMMTPVTAQFPQQRVVAALEKWWASESSARITDPFARKDTLFAMLPDVDSLSLVNALLVVEQEIGFNPPVTVIKRGGYRDCKEMIEHLVPGIRRSYEKKHP